MKEALIQFQKDAFRTYTDLGSKRKNGAHMLMGILTEFGELLDIYKKNLAYGKPVDLVHVQEEWADGMWYVVLDGYIQKESFFDPQISYTEKLFDTFDKDDDLILFTFMDAYDTLTHPMGYLRMLDWYMSIGKYLGIDRELALKNCIDKLKSRYPEKFTAEKALNRDLVAERAELEKK